MPKTGKSSADVNEIIGAKIRFLREQAKLTQKELGDRLGVSDQKVLSLELGRTRALVSDVVEIAAALRISPLTLLEGVVELPDLVSYHTARLGDLARRAPDSVNHTVASDLWIERYYRIKYRMDYRPIYYTLPCRLPLQFVEEWSLPLPTSPRRLVYIAVDIEGIAGYFFPNEIVPAPTTEQHDTPEFTDIEKWKDNAELEEFLRRAGYCWQLYPIRMHHDQFCGPVHRAEIEAQRRSAALPGARDA
jgi:transcriptional regulator with XRE-family HTH domain